jgi:hypothetical protein
MVYNIGDEVEDIYFILEGAVTLFIDMLDFIEDLELLERGQEINKTYAERHKNHEHQGKKAEGGFQKPTVKSFIKYCQGGYFGDSDHFGSFLST